jgi:hypothetical protein
MEIRNLKYAVTKEAYCAIGNTGVLCILLRRMSRYKVCHLKADH